MGFPLIEIMFCMRFITRRVSDISKAIGDKNRLEKIIGLHSPRISIVALCIADRMVLLHHI
jgi:hypothetical protein